MPKKRLQPNGREQVRRFIQKRGITQKTLAAELGIHEATLSALLSGHDYPSLDLAVRLENITGVPARAFNREAVA